MKKSNQSKAALKTPNPNEVIECRGATWRFLKEDSGFWELELIKQGAVFAENPTHVWALPHLEERSIRVLTSSEALTPQPTEDQREKGALYKPLLQVRRNHSLQDTSTSKEPNTAVHCAIEQKSWQFEPWRRIVDALPFPRLLIADDVGLGKTTEAAIILTELARRRRADRILVIVPQHLAEKWQTELYERFGLAFEIFDRDTRARLSDRGIRNPWEIVERVIVSRDFVKRWENLHPISKVAWDMVVIDECHHFVREKHMPPTRLREFAEKVAYKSPGLLLLSATPFTGSKPEFKSLLHLLDPKFTSDDIADKWDPRNPYLLRRLKGDVKKNGELILDRQIKTIKIMESDLSKNEKAVLERVHSELQEHHGSKKETWDRLLEETARKRLSSGWLAFLETISGDRKLSTWFSDKTKTQIKNLVETQDSAKLKALDRVIGEILQHDPQSKIVVFTEALASQKQIHEFLTMGSLSSQKNGVETIEGQTPREQRTAIEEAFANPNSKLRVLVATDTISEGKDLQHACNHLIHFELPWSLVKIEQRNGRIDRLGQSKQPTIYNLVFDTLATPDQKIIDRLTAKLEVARVSLGSVSPIIEQFEDLSLLDVQDSSALEVQIDERKAEAESFNFTATGVTPLSSAPISSTDDYMTRQTNFELMVKTLSGNLTPYGRNNADQSHNVEFLLSLPEGWELPGLSDLGESYPTEVEPWRITFSSKVFLEYEKYRREHGEGSRPLHFISPVHPINIQVEGRFRSRLSRQGYPIFKLSNSDHHSKILMVELTARSKSTRVLAQKIIALELNHFKEIDIDTLGEFKGIDGAVPLPSGTEWKQIEGVLELVAKQYVNALSDSYGVRLQTYLKEQNTIPDGAEGKKQREEWLHNLWEVDTEQTGFHILALLIGK